MTLLYLSLMAMHCGCCRYNFHLFPRDELKIGMPSYSFSCQTSFLDSLVQEDFDFNACIYNGKLGNLMTLTGIENSNLSFQTSGNNKNISTGEVNLRS